MKTWRADSRRVVQPLSSCDKPVADSARRAKTFHGVYASVLTAARVGGAAGDLSRQGQFTKEIAMRADGPLVGAVIFLGIGLGLILGYCHGSTGMSAAYPLAGSTLHIDLTTTGPAVLGGVTCTAVGALLLIWAFLAAIVDMFTWREHSRERIVQRYDVVPAANGTTYTETPVVTQRKHFWSRPTTRSHV
jgi:hypothetical protein